MRYLQSALRISLAIKTLAAKEIRFTNDGFEFVMENPEPLTSIEVPLPELRRF